MKESLSNNIPITAIGERGSFHPIGKMKAHIDGTLHLAISIFLINEKREILLQKRSLNKYHSGGLWANTCCSHPLFGESLEVCAHRRLEEELGIKTELKPINEIDYKCNVGDLIEYERVTWFKGFLHSNKKINFNKDEVMDLRWVSLKDLEVQALETPELFANWLHEYLKLGLVRILS
jgi:isopentenyl-diphosphate delta-isomerase